MNKGTNIKNNFKFITAKHYFNFNKCAEYIEYK